MGYCASTDIQAEFRALDLSTSTVIKPGQVDEWIAQSSNEIDSRIGIKYVTPVTGTKSLSVLKMICVWLVADRVRDVLEVRQANPNTGQVVKAGDASADARAMLKDIAENRMLLSDAVLVNSSNGLTSWNSSKSQGHTFNRNDDQW